MSNMLPMFPDDTPSMDLDKIRKVWHDNEWYYSIVDVVSWATGRDQKQAKDYWKNLKSELKRAGNQTISQPYTFKMPAPDGKMRATDFGNAEQILRVVQEIPGAKTNEIKEWLAQVGAERLETGGDPEEELKAALDRVGGKYRRQGKSDTWIEARIQGIITRKLFVEALKAAVINAPGTLYSQATDNLYLGLWERTTAQLRDELVLMPKDNPRDSFGEYALLYTRIAEMVATNKLDKLEIVTMTMAMDIVWEVARLIHTQAQATAHALGMDLVTEKKLLNESN